MNTNDYIKELQSHLSVLDKGKKNEIIEEIKSYIEESNATYDLLVERFGTPKELATNYLEDMPINEASGNKMWSRTKKYIITMLVSLVVIVLLVALVIYFITKDPYDYSSYNAKTIEQKIEAPWVSFKDITKLDFAQSKVIVYGTSEDKVSLSCKTKECVDEDGNSIDCFGSKNTSQNNTLFIKQSSCFLKLPKEKMDIKIYQSKVIIVEPKDRLNLDVEQSRISLASKNTRYQYNFMGKQSDIENFTSQRGGIMIKGKFYQSKITPYEY